MNDANAALAPQLQEQVLTKLGFSRAPEPTLEGLRSLYAAWCQRVPFDNVRKIIHMRADNPGPLPGSTAEDYFTAWLKHGTGGTCWAGARGLHALLVSLGFDAVRGLGTMLAAPNLPPNHGTVRVSFDGVDYLVDTSILCGEPLRLDASAETRVEHPAWGVRCVKRDGRWHIAWRPLHKLDGFECRLERFEVASEDYQSIYDQTRGWSPFNYEVTARRNGGDNVVGLAFGHSVSLLRDGKIEKSPAPRADRVRVLIEEIGLSQEIVDALPEDIPTPPPPWSKTAQTRN